MNSRKKQTFKEAEATFEDRLSNIRLHIRCTDQMKTSGFLSFPIGKCYSIPLFDDGDFWGIYCLGPYVEPPKSLSGRLPTVDRILFKWLKTLFDREQGPKYRIKAELRDQLGLTTPNGISLEGYAGIFLRHISHYEHIRFTLLATTEQASEIITDIGAEHELKATLQGLTFADPHSEAIKEQLRAYLSQSTDQPMNHLHIEVLNTMPSPLYLMVGARSSDSLEQYLRKPIHTQIIRTLEAIIKFREQSTGLARQILDTYYLMIRDLERRSERSRYHSARMSALTAKFADYAELEPHKKYVLQQTARIHDIGYLNVHQFADRKTMGPELEHPLLGTLLVQYLPIDEDIKQGIKTHHEWIDGSGTPEGLQEEDIPWNGAIIGIFEFIIEFIESALAEGNREVETQQQRLLEALDQRSGHLFNEQYLPVLQKMIEDLGWEELCKAGEDHG